MPMMSNKLIPFAIIFLLLIPAVLSAMQSIAVNDELKECRPYITGGLPQIFPDGFRPLSDNEREAIKSGRSNYSESEDWWGYQCTILGYSYNAEMLKPTVSKVVDFPKLIFIIVFSIISLFIIWKFFKATDKGVKSILILLLKLLALFIILYIIYYFIDFSLYQCKYLEC